MSIRIRKKTMINPIASIGIMILNLSILNFLLGKYSIVSLFRTAKFINSCSPFLVKIKTPFRNLYSLSILIRYIFQKKYLQ